MQGPLLHLRRDADVSLGCGQGAVLKELLHEDDIIAIVIIDFRGIELAEGVGAYVSVSEVVGHLLKVFLHRALADWEKRRIHRNAIFRGVEPYVLVDREGDREGSLLFCFLFCDVQAVTVAVCDDVAKP